MALISAKSISLSFGERTLFGPDSFEIQNGEKVAIIGTNGSGKTTLFKLLTGAVQPDTGAVVRQKGLRVGYMEQIVSAKSEMSAYDAALSIFSKLGQLETDLDKLTEMLQTGDQQLIEQHHRLREKFELMGGLTYRARTHSALIGLGLKEDQLSLPLSKLSGGQLSKISLARLLLSDSQLMLLDEPTNHLDIESVEWLESYIKAYKGAALIISHDRYFLDAVTSRTLEIEHGHITDYKGSYSRCLELKAERRESERRQYENTLAEIQRLEAVIKQQHQWNKEKNIKTADSKQKVVDRLRAGLVKPESETEGIRFKFTPRNAGGNEVVSVRNLSFSYGDNKLYSGVNFTVRRGERIFLLGANGCGKTTLLKQLLKESDGIRFGSAIDIGYFDQTQSTLSGNKTALDEIWDAFPDKSQSEVRGALASFLFKNDDVFKAVSELSGGERARLMILKTMLAGDNFLLLDEPTNHLDLYSRQALEDALADYPGTMLIVSHDRRFIDRLADRIFVMENGGITVYNGNYTYYVDKRKPAETVLTEHKSVGAGGAAYKAKKEQQSAMRKLRTRLSAIETEIEENDAAIADKNILIDSDPSDYVRVGELTQEIADLNEKQERLMSEWAEVSELLEAGQANAESL